ARGARARPTSCASWCWPSCGAARGQARPRAARPRPKASSRPTSSRRAAGSIRRNKRQARDKSAYGLCPEPGDNQRIAKRRLMLAAAVAALLATPGTAALQQGAHVPSLVTQGALDGRPFPFNLQQALRQGPVVLYFFPKANTPGCNLEAKAFAEKIGDF